MLAERDHVFLMHVIRRKTMKQREPCAGTPEEPFAPGLARVFGMVDKLGPTIAIRRNRAHGSQINRCASAVEPLHKIVPGDVESEILRLVNDPQAILEADDPDRTPAVVRIGKIPVDPGNPAVGIRTQNIPSNSRQIRVKAESKFARRLDPLPDYDRNQPQKYGLCL